MGRFINPFSDWGFKRIFGEEMSKSLLIHFLNDLFEGEHVITDLTFMNKEQLALTKDERDTIYDVYCLTDKGQNIIVEMQNKFHANFVDRIIYYTARSIDKQGKIGSYWDYKLTPVYTICFMNFNIHENSENQLRMDIVLANKDTGQMFSDQIRFVFLALPFFNKDAGECESNFERWIYVLKNMEKLDRLPFEKQINVMGLLAQVADISTLSSHDRERYDESMKILWDKSIFYLGAREEREYEIAKKMISDGLSNEQISHYTDLSYEEIDKIRSDKIVL